MGFGTELQARSSHEALLDLQDVEIRLLENMKKCLTQRIKCDRDYAESLKTVINSGMKLDVSSMKTPLCDVWLGIMNVTEDLVKTIKEFSDKLCVDTLEKLMQLISKKRSIRKTYSDERERLDHDLSELQSAVTSCQSQYTRAITKCLQSQQKYKEAFDKGKPGTKFEEVKARYTKSGTKLHQCHNELIIGIHEANIYQQQYTRSLLPELLSYQQMLQENFVVDCKEILESYACITDFSSTQYKEIFQRVHSTVSKVIPAAEYDDFITKNRSAPVRHTKHEFPKDSVSNSSTLTAGEIAKDDLTNDTLEQQKNNYAELLEKCRLRISNKQHELSEMKEQPANSISRQLQHSEAVQNLTRELTELTCLEERYSSLVKLVQESLDNNETKVALPDLIDFDKSDTDTTTTTTASYVHRLPTFTNFKASIAQRLKKPHPGLPSVSAVDSSSSAREPVEARQSYSYNSYSSSEQQSPPVNNNEQHENTNIDEEYDRLVAEEWFHGVLPREEVQRLLVRDGDFLVRQGTNKDSGQPQYVLSALWKTPKHFIIVSTPNGWKFEGEPRATISELINHQWKNEIPVTNKTQVILRSPVIREEWELRNDDITLANKIGSGQFGDVYCGAYKGTNKKVAVKLCKDHISPDAKKKFLQEGRVLKQFDHPNIVQFIGIAAQRNPVMIVMEYVSGGALNKYLPKHRTKLTVDNLMKMCLDAASGMEYLESKNCLHRDLAARNCLVGDNNIVKISDFGMSRNEEIYMIGSGQKQIPIKWTAPEALNYGSYDWSCDVWSFGILMWEVFSFGDSPYSGLSNAQAREKVDAGYRMPAPPGTPTSAAELMLRCWDQDPKERPHFSEIVRCLQDILK